MTIVAQAAILREQDYDIDMGAIYEPKTMELNNSLAPLLSQVRMAMLSGMDEEFLRDEEVASLEVTAAQFVIIANDPFPVTQPPHKRLVSGLKVKDA